MTAAEVTRTAAAVVILAGAATATAAVARLPDPLRQYVSEAGVPGAATADLYLVGLLLVAAGVGLLAAGLARLPWLVWTPLLVAAPMTVISFPSWQVGRRSGCTSTASALNSGVNARREREMLNDAVQPHAMDLSSPARA